MMQQRREICVGKRKTRDNLRTIGRDDALFGRGGSLAKRMEKRELE